jgi:hypothetical protein
VINIRFVLVLAALLVTLIITAMSVYLALPWLVANYAADFARPYGVDIQSLGIGRPGWRVLRIDTLELRSGDVELSLEHATVRYRLPELLRGELRQLQVEQADVVLHESPLSSPEHGRVPGSAETPPDLARLFALVPFAQVDIAKLTAEIRQLDFRSEGSLRLKDQQLMFKLRGLAPEQAEGLSLEGAVAADGGIQLVLALLQQANTIGSDRTDYDEFLRIDSQLVGDTLKLTMAADLSGYPFQLVSALAGMPAGKGELEASVETSLQWPIDAMNLEDLAATGDYRLNWRSTDESLRVSGLAGIVDFAESRVQARFSGGELKYQDETSSLSVTLPDGIAVSWTEPQLRISQGVVVHLEQSDLELKGAGEVMTVSFLEQPEVSAGLSAEVSTADYEHSGVLRIDAVIADTDRITGDGTWLTQGWQLPFQFSHVLSKAAGKASSEGRLNINKPLAAALLASWDEPYDLDSGTLDYDLNVSWSQQVSARLQLDFEKITAHYEDDQVMGIAGRLELVLQDDQLSMAPAKLTAADFDPGVRLTDIEMTLGLKEDVLSVKDAGFRTLGGRVQASDFVYDLAAETPDLRFQLQLESLDLAELLALQGGDIAGTGRISGILPVRVRNELPSISGGQVSSLPPGGLIQLSPDIAGVSSQPGLDFAIQALTDYRFTSLAASVDYLEDGELKLGVSLQGANPEVEKGRPIHYNLNVTQNLLVLLQSLRAQRAVTQGLERRVFN